MLRTVRNHAGFTFIEVMVTLIILSMLTIAVLHIVSNTYRVQAGELSNHKTREQYQEITILLTKDVKNAKSVAVANDSTGDTLTLSMYDGTTNTYRFDRATGNFIYNGKTWFTAQPLRSTNPVTIQYDSLQNTIYFYLSISQKDKPALPFDLVVSPRYKTLIE